MNEKPIYTSLMDYLNKTGVLERAKPEEIAEAKKAYRRYYMRQYKREQRGNKQELVLSIPKGFHKQLNREATRHGVTTARLVLEIIKAHINDVSVIHHPDEFAQVEVAVAKLHSELTFIGDQMLQTLVAPDIEQLKEKIETIEQMVQEASNSVRLEDFLKTHLKDNPDLKPQLVELLQQLLAE